MDDPLSFDEDPIYDDIFDGLITPDDDQSPITTPFLDQMLDNFDDGTVTTLETPISPSFEDVFDEDKPESLVDVFSQDVMENNNRRNQGDDINSNATAPQVSPPPPSSPKYLNNLLYEDQVNILKLFRRTELQRQLQRFPHAKSWDIMSYYIAKHPWNQGLWAVLWRFDEFREFNKRNDLMNSVQVMNMFWIMFKPPPPPERNMNHRNLRPPPPPIVPPPVSASQSNFMDQNAFDRNPFESFMDEVEKPIPPTAPPQAAPPPLPQQVYDQPLTPTFDPWANGDIACAVPPNGRVLPTNTSSKTVGTKFDDDDDEEDGEGLFGMMEEDDDGREGLSSSDEEEETEEVDEEPISDDFEDIVPMDDNGGLDYKSDVMTSEIHDLSSIESRKDEFKRAGKTGNVRTNRRKSSSPPAMPRRINQRQHSKRVNKRKSPVVRMSGRGGPRPRPRGRGGYGRGGGAGRSSQMHHSPRREERKVLKKIPSKPSSSSKKSKSSSSSLFQQSFSKSKAKKKKKRMKMKRTPQQQEHVRLVSRDEYFAKPKNPPKKRAPTGGLEWNTKGKKQTKAFTGTHGNDWVAKGTVKPTKEFVGTHGNEWTAKGTQKATKEFVGTVGEEWSAKGTQKATKEFSGTYGQEWEAQGTKAVSKEFSGTHGMEWEEEKVEEEIKLGEEDREIQEALMRHFEEQKKQKEAETIEREKERKEDEEKVKKKIKEEEQMKKKFEEKEKKKKKKMNLEEWSDKFARNVEQIRNKVLTRLFYYKENISYELEKKKKTLKEKNKDMELEKEILVLERRVRNCERLLLMFGAQ